MTARLYEEHAKVFEPSLRGVNGKHLIWNMNPEFESFDEDFAYDPRLLCGVPETAWDLSNLSDLSPEMDDASRPLGDVPLIMVGSLLVDDPAVERESCRDCLEHFTRR